MNKAHCDGGCGMIFGEHGADRQPAVTGHRSDGFMGAGLPAGEFHLCDACARVAFGALKVKEGAR